MKLLVTGFPVFSGREQNPSEELIQELQRTEWNLPGVTVHAELLPVEYSGVEKEFERVCEEFQPDVVLAFGLGRQQQFFQLETRGLNWDSATIPDNSGELREGVMIDADEPDQLRTELDLESLGQELENQGLSASVSQDAGTYICNHLLFHALSKQSCFTNSQNFLFTHLASAEHGTTVEKSLAALHIMARWFHNHYQSHQQRELSSLQSESSKTKATRMSSSTSAKYWLGFDLGGTKMLAQIYDQDWNVIAKERKRIRPGTGVKGGIERIIETIQEALKKADLTTQNLHGIGIGCPGPIDMENGMLLDLPNLGWEAVPLKASLESQLQCPVAVLNDVDAGVYAEYRVGAAKGARCAIGVFAGTGIGGGCIYQGEILRGQTTSAFEIGHLQVMSNGPRCGCGQRGCLESVASRLAIAAQAARAAYRGDAPHLLEASGTDLSQIRSGALSASIKAGDDAVEDIIEEAARYVGIAIGGVVNLLCPDIVILGGGLVEAMPDLFVAQTTKSANKRAMPAFKNTFKIVPAELKDDAGALGAALWAEHVLKTA